MHTLSPKYVLRKERKDVHVLYNRATLLKSVISPKLYLLLSLFRNDVVSISELKDSCSKNGIDFSDFSLFISNPKYSDVLIEVQEDYHPIDISVPQIDTPSSVQPSPARIDFFITKHCNLACKHCFEGSSPQFKNRYFSEIEIKQIIRQLEATNIQTLKITGGEPFSHPNIDTLLCLLKDCHFETIILTNALLLTPERISLIKKGDFQLGISLDGISPYTHDYIRGKGAFKRLDEILIKLKQSDITFCVTCTVNHRNYNELPEIATKAIEYYGAKSLFLNRLRPMGRSTSNNELILSEEENEQVQHLCKELEQKYPNKILLGDDSIIECNNIGDVIECSAGNSLFAIDENFDVFPCIYGIGNPDFLIGNLITDGITNIWQSSKWHRFRRGTKLEDLVECNNCIFNKKCSTKNCRLKPVYEGLSFYDAVSYCKKNLCSSEKQVCSPIST